MKEYIKMSDYISGKAVVKFSGVVTAVEYTASNGELMMRDVHAALSHAINSHDELVEINKELLYALESLIDDMRLRAKLDGDVDSDGTVILNCGNGVLFAATKAMDKAKR